MTGPDPLSLSEEVLQSRLETAASDFLGRPAVVVSLRQLTAGAAAQTWRFDLEGFEQSLILRRGSDEQQFAGALGKADEARVIQAAVAAGVAAPSILGVLTPEHALGEGFVMACVEGETLPPRILREPRYQKARAGLAAQCGEALAAIHAVSGASVQPLPQSDAAAQIDFYETSYRDFDHPLPVFDAAFQVLRRSLAQRPSADSDVTLVHGDFRNGNLIVGEEGLRAVLDWELSHLGDPMEDLGWLCVNSWRFGVRDKPVGGFGEREALYSAYEAASGRSVDPRQVRFWELFGVLKWGVICLYQCQAHLSGVRRSVERAAIGRRVSECELDIVDLLEGGQ